MRPTSKLSGKADRLVYVGFHAVRSDRSKLLTETVLEGREACKSGRSRSVPLNHIAGRVERVVVGGDARPALRETARPVAEEVGGDSRTAI